MNEQAMMMNQQQQHQQLMNMNPNMMILNQMNPQQSQPQMLPINRSYGVWPPHLSQPPFQNPNPNVGAVNPLPSTVKNPLGPRSSWKGKRMNNPKDKRRKEQHKSLMMQWIVCSTTTSSPMDCGTANQFDKHRSKLGENCTASNLISGDRMQNRKPYSVPCAARRNLLDTSQQLCT